MRPQARSVSVVAVPGTTLPFGVARRLAVATCRTSAASDLDFVLCGLRPEDSFISMFTLRKHSMLRKPLIAVSLIALAGTLTGVLAQPAQRGTQYALLIAVSKYAKNDQWKPLPYTIDE